MTPWRAPLAPSPVTGEVVVPGSKSATARSYLLAALADGPSTLQGVLAARDTALMRAGLEVLGVAFTDLSAGRVRVVPPDRFRGGGVVDVGLAGTVMRFLPPLAALASPATRFVGDPQASARPVAPLLGGLADLGAQVSRPHRLPFSVEGFLTGTEVTIDSSASSQFVSALLLVGARLPGGLTVRHAGGALPSLPHIAMTIRMLAGRGVGVEPTGETAWRVRPGPIAALDENVEPDLTNAATLLAAAVATGGRLTTAWPEDSLQAADALAGALAAFGAELSYSGAGAARRLTAAGPRRLAGVDLDLHEISELTPVVAALASLADSPSVIRGVGHIRHHETDRLAALESGLSGLGGRARQTADGLAIEPSPLHGGGFASHADHRLAHAAAIIGLVVPGVELDDVECTSKT
ncbi:MAG: 3-phosphoshikimate 1-carboxyvinyltransferase, partial [Propionicimonas sp.]|nr:3-phosphoshikimate 1-carboxyvinyltransferase [Propionicimonas sp.]